jgi:hypothetical protein
MNCWDAAKELFRNRALIESDTRLLDLLRDTRPAQSAMIHRMIGRRWKRNRDIIRELRTVRWPRKNDGVPDMGGF